MNNSVRVGIDIGSTTVKVVAIAEDNSILFQKYKRHLSETKNTALELIKEAYEVLGNIRVSPMMTGSGGVALAEAL